MNFEQTTKTSLAPVLLQKTTSTTPHRCHTETGWFAFT